jgi:hypothetical protein
MQALPATIKIHHIATILPHNLVSVTLLRFNLETSLLQAAFPQPKRILNGELQYQYGGKMETNL